MNTDTLLTRRTVVARLGASAASAALLAADPLGMPVGCELYPVRDQVAKDFEGALRMVAAMGYKTVEMCSPAGYAKSGFGALVDRKPKQIRASIRAAGLTCESCHYTFGELKDNLDERIGYAKHLGLKQMIVASFGLTEDATIAEWDRAAARLNLIGERVRKAHLQLGYHNHDREFAKVDGVFVYDRLMQGLDPNLVKMQFQTAVVRLGFDAAPYFEKYPGRFLSMHLADWSPATKQIVAVGSGVIDWKKLFSAARVAGVKNYFVEVAPDAMPASCTYLHQLRV